MNFYEILNVNPSASQREIERAYHLGVHTYRRNSLALHGLLSEKERQRMLKMIEDAYQTLKDPQKRKKYDSRISQEKYFSSNRFSIRKTIRKLIIEDADTG